MSKKKLLYVAPHLSTGGQPQYLYKQVKEFIKDFEIEVVEINNSGGNAFVVQKNRIKSLVPIHTLAEDKSEIINIINEFNPDIIHFQEIPQFDLAPFVLDKIFERHLVSTKNTKNRLNIEFGIYFSFFLYLN
mgnify:CR=1 FL=1